MTRKIINNLIDRLNDNGIMLITATILTICLPGLETRWLAELNDNGISVLHEQIESLSDDPDYLDVLAELNSEDLMRAVIECVEDYTFTD